MNRESNFMPTPDQDVLEVKPLRTLAPMFPAPLGVDVLNRSTTPPLVFVAPAGQFSGAFGAWNNPAIRSFAAFGVPDAGGDQGAGDSQTAAFGDQEIGRGQSAANGTPNIGTSATEPIEATPISAYKSTQPIVISLDDDNNDDEPYTGNQTSTSGRKIKRPSHLSGYNMSDSLGIDGSNGTKKRPKSSSRKAANDNDLSFMPPSSDPREIVEVVLMTFEALRRRHLQLDETQETSKRADLKAGAIMLASNLRANTGKRIGAIPGVEVGDIFYFRMELCIIGLHAPSMGGIDYMNAKFGDEDDSIAICIVAAGVYENDDDDTDTLVYSGSGGISRNSEERHDQKLERGNLALERSLSRKNVIRVVRGYKDPACLTGKVYIYDGLYKIHESWKEKTKTGISCFKYKLQREPGQPDAVAIWKSSQRWVENPTARGGVLHPDLSSGAENLPVCLINDVNSEKGPGHFNYITQVKYLKPLSSMKPFQGCGCLSVCLPGDNNCVCAQHNGGDLPYSSSGLLVCRKLMVYECGESCQCSFNCRNRVSQKGVRIHFEIFRTTNRGWGLRSWDPIRAGSFICEFVGEVVDDTKVNLDGEDDYLFQTVCPGEKTLKWNYGPELIGEPSINISAETFEPLPIKISAKKMGNVARFMNHSCNPNTFWQPVQFDHGEDSYPHIMFFALKHIPPMTELTYDYGDIGCESSSVGSTRAKNCLCGSSNCRGYFS
ncbi:histone-lysine N-methyltransferase, H3 lysine-9 specific SUVH1-like [Oryza brachyantha]|uniref:Histone-lysine N-methyltransferase n=1 Tax=Oryza brachyantha TaxID=4533 RepID=J3L546_ORYBR|nr:histone-lysine N-methyltransferase, H3 lysine-9 specific SUVH1-like [Oryza brachyantha]XP_015688272.1 histone-lysine N-methyltransferase, H3 lysine-9 specific SUVH1-like [Oryza brachyantha]